MAWKPRFHRVDVFYQVMLRGNNDQQIFFSNDDRCQLCLLIQQSVERFGKLSKNSNDLSCDLHRESLSAYRLDNGLGRIFDKSRMI